MELKDKTAIVTGGAGNLGSVVTRRLLDEGARVIVPWYKEDNWQALLADLPDQLSHHCEGRAADLTREEDVRSTIQTAVERFEGLDILLNLVGGFAFGKKVWETDAGLWDKMMEMNLKSAFLCCKHAVPHMIERGSGRIVNVTSKACVDVQPGAAAYAVSKGGVITLTRALRQELKGTGVTVNAIMPGIIDTPVTRELMPNADTEKWASRGEIADALVALCTDRLHGVSGSVLRLFGDL